LPGTQHILLIMITPLILPVVEGGRIDGMVVIFIVKTEIDREECRYRISIPWESIDAGYTFTDTKQETMEKAEVCLNEYNK
jgi:hypothetical protein